MTDRAGDDRTEACARQLDYLFHEAIQDNRLAFLAYLIGMAAQVASDEAARRRAIVPVVLTSAAF